MTVARTKAAGATGARGAEASGEAERAPVRWWGTEMSSPGSELWASLPNQCVPVLPLC